MNVIVILIDTLRRDHLGCYGSEAASRIFAKPIETPNLDLFAARSAVFEQAHLGSFPCLPLRRDLWTGRYEFPWRGWGALEDTDLDIAGLLRSHGVKTMYIGDHYHLLERDAGNYLFGFEGWDMIRGQEHDPYITDSDLPSAGISRLNNAFWDSHQKSSRGKVLREEERFAPRVFRKAAQWLEGNGTKEARGERPFFLMLECFDPHEPWDPPLDMVDALDPDYQGERPHCPLYGPADQYTPEEMKQIRAMYAAELTLVDRWFGRFMQTFDRLGLAEDTMVMVTTDHGFYLGEHGLFGKPNGVPLYNEMSHVPFMLYHPNVVPGIRPKQLVQMVDVFPTVLDALGISVPVYEPKEFVVGLNNKKAWEGISEDSVHLHGSSMIALICGNSERWREAAFTGKFGDIIRVSNGEWNLYLTPSADNPIYWYGSRAPGRTFEGTRGTFDRINGRYPIQYPGSSYRNELYNVKIDYTEQVNVIDQYPEQAKMMMRLFLQWLEAIGAPKEVADRYGVTL